MRGICFKEPMFEAVVKGQKTQTSRLSHLESINKDPGSWTKLQQLDAEKFIFSMGPSGILIKPYYHMDEVLYLKEPYFICKGKPCYKYLDSSSHIYPSEYWKNKLFMPAEYARYHIKITGIKLRRINDITPADAIAEGFKTPGGFHTYWIGMYGFSSLSLNPWTFAYDFSLTNK